MRSKLLLIAGTGIAFALAGCATRSDYVDSQNISRSVKNPYNLSSSDFVKAADEAIVFLMASNEWKTYLAEYAQAAEAEFKKQNPNTPMPSRLKTPTLILNTIVNNTANELSGGDYFDPKFLTERIRSCLAKPNLLNETILCIRQAHENDRRLFRGPFGTAGPRTNRPRWTGAHRRYSRPRRWHRQRLRKTRSPKQRPALRPLTQRLNLKNGGTRGTPFRTELLFCTNSHRLQNQRGHLALVNRN